jgi:hypothetical protein
MTTEKKDKVFEFFMADTLLERDYERGVDFGGRMRNLRIMAIKHLRRIKDNNFVDGLLEQAERNPIVIRRVVGSADHKPGIMMKLVIEDTDEVRDEYKKRILGKLSFGEKRFLGLI